jgi:DNA-binding transcriptional MerR regulator
VLLIRRIRELLYQDGFTISGARNRLDEVASRKREDAEESVGLREQMASIRAEIKSLLQDLQS